MKMGVRVLILDDDVAFRERLGKALTEHGHITRTFGSLAEVRQGLQQEVFSHALLDLRLTEESGLDLVRELSDKGIKTVMLTGYGSVAVALEAVRLGAANFISKPTSITAIEQALLGEKFAPQRDLEDSSVPSLDQVEWEHIQRVLRDCSGNITHAAKRLGLHRQALQRKLRVGPEV